MARIRTIKPDFFKNEQLAELPVITRLLFIGLWTQADSEGRLIDRPKRLKVELFPYDNCDVEKCLNELHNAGFILRYKVNANSSARILAPEQPVTKLAFIQINNFLKHQRITGKELTYNSEYPPPDKGETTGKQLGNNRDHRKGKERNKERNGDDGKDAAPATYGNSVLKNITDLKQDCLNDQINFVEHLCRQCKILPEEVPKYLEDFNSHLRSLGEVIKGIKDYRSHAQNWIKKQPATSNGAQAQTVKIKIK
jgi:hypothetical protein